MIELLGIAMPSSEGAWLFRRVSALVETPELVAVVSEDRDTRLALLDAITARRVPVAGRVWIDGYPLTSDTQSRVRARVVEVDLRTVLGASLAPVERVGRRRRSTPDRRLLAPAAIRPVAARRRTRACHRRASPGRERARERA